MLAHLLGEDFVAVLARPAVKRAAGPAAALLAPLHHVLPARARALAEHLLHVRDLAAEQEASVRRRLEVRLTRAERMRRGARAARRRLQALSSRPPRRATATAASTAGRSIRSSRRLRAEAPSTAHPQVAGGGPRLRCRRSLRLRDSSSSAAAGGASSTTTATVSGATSGGLRRRSCRLRRRRRRLPPRRVDTHRLAPGVVVAAALGGGAAGGRRRRRPASRPPSRRPRCPSSPRAVGVGRGESVGAFDLANLTRTTHRLRFPFCPTSYHRFPRSLEFVEHVPIDLVAPRFARSMAPSLITPPARRAGPPAPAQFLSRAAPRPDPPPAAEFSPRPRRRDDEDGEYTFWDRTEFSCARRRRRRGGVRRPSAGGRLGRRGRLGRARGHRRRQHAVPSTRSRSTPTRRRRAAARAAATRRTR